MGEAPTEKSSRVRPPKNCEEEVSLFERSNVQSLKLLSKKISGLSMIFEIGKLCATKKFHYTSRGVVSKIIMFTVCRLLKKDLDSLSLNVWLTKFIQ